MTVSEEAVEAAVKAWDLHWGDRYGDEAVEEMGEEVSVALEAAAPFIAAKAFEDAAKELRGLQYVRPDAPGREEYEAMLAIRRGDTDAWLLSRAAGLRGQG